MFIKIEIERLAERARQRLARLKGVFMEETKRAQLPILLRWVPADQKWHMLNYSNGKFIQEFYDCGNIEMLFPAAQKDRDNVFILTGTFLKWLPKKLN